MTMVPLRTVRHRAAPYLTLAASVAVPLCAALNLARLHWRHVSGASQTRGLCHGGACRGAGRRLGKDRLVRAQRMAPAQAGRSCPV